MIDDCVDAKHYTCEQREVVLWVSGGRKGRNKNTLKVKAELIHPVFKASEIICVEKCFSSFLLHIKKNIYKKRAALRPPERSLLFSSV